MHRAVGLITLALKIKCLNLYILLGYVQNAVAGSPSGKYFEVKTFFTLCGSNNSNYSARFLAL